MILRAFFMDREVLINIPGGALVFDGNAYVDPHEAKWIALGITNHAIAMLPEQDYPVRFDSAQAKHCWVNHWVAKVVGIDSETGTHPGFTVDANYIPDPNGDGGCVCGVTCVGTEIQNVPVYAVPTLL